MTLVRNIAKRIVQTVAVVLFLPALVLVVGPLFIAFGAYAALNNAVAEMCFRHRMKACGRFLRQRSLSQRIACDGPGTLIIESPTLGWRITHAWWTPDLLSDNVPFSPPTDEEVKCAAEEMKSTCWDRFVWDNYTSPDTGNAYLLRVWNGNWIERTIRREHPTVAIAHAWTALPNIEDRKAKLAG